MPANRTVTSLSIALIVFVMLTFVLAVTTYLFFKQRFDEEGKAVAAAAETAKARAELKAAQDERVKLQEILGAAAEKTIAQIEAETNDRFTNGFVGFDAEPKNYQKLVDWLAAAIRVKDEQMNSLRQEHEKSLADKDRAIEAQKSAAERATAERDRIAADATTEKKKFDDSRQTHEQQQTRLTAEQKEALDLSIAYDKLKAEVAKGLGELERNLPEKAKEFQAKGDPEGQLDVLYAAVRLQGNLLREQNERLAKLRVADPAIQAAVDAALPKDDRIDGFDGRVVTVDPAARTALVSTASTRGLRPGLLLSVYDPKDPRPQFGSRKGMLEVIAVEGPTVARARIRRDSVQNPILGGDGVATSLWAPGETPEIVIVGQVQLDDDAGTEFDALKGFVERSGGRIVDGVTPSTAVVVDAGAPAKAAADGKAAGWKATDERRREREIKAARSLGIRVVSLGEMLELLGVERADIGGTRLPRRADDGRGLPRRSAGVAY